MADGGLITGRVNARGEAVVPLAIHGDVGRRVDVRFVVDTGFNGQVSLPFQFIRDLGLLCIGADFGTLADGSRVAFDVFLATAFMFGKPRRVKVDAMESPPTIGTELLLGHTLHAEWVPGGQVTIAPLMEV